MTARQKAEKFEDGEQNTRTSLCFACTQIIYKQPENEARNIGLEWDRHISRVAGE